MRISENKVYRYSPVPEDIVFNNGTYWQATDHVFCSHKVPGMPRQTMPKAFVYVYAAERFDGIASTHWMRGRLLGMARIGSIQPVRGGKHATLISK